MYQLLKDATLGLEGNMFFIPIMELCHGLLVAHDMRAQEAYRSILSGKGPLAVFLIYACLCLGSNTTVGFFLLQRPSWTIRPEVFPTYVGAWMLVYFSPRDSVYRVLKKQYVFPLLVIVVGASWGSAITEGGILKAERGFGKESAFMVMIVILAGLLAGIASDIIGHLIRDPKLITPKEKWSNGHFYPFDSLTLHIAVAGTLFFYLATNPVLFSTPVMPIDDAKFTVFWLSIFGYFPFYYPPPKKPKNIRKRMYRKMYSNSPLFVQQRLRRPTLLDQLIGDEKDSKKQS
eukprot:Nk52_evm8s259 gene=Nk52_evmTU8s259